MKAFQQTSGTDDMLVESLIRNNILIQDYTAEVWILKTLGYWEVTEEK